MDLRDSLGALDFHRPAVADIEIRTAGAHDAQAWDAFVSDAEQSTFFHRFAWQPLLSEALGYEPRYLCAYQAGRLTGVLPLMHVRSRLFGASLTSLPFCSYAGVLAGQAASRDALIAAAARLGAELQARHVELRHLEPQQADAPRQDLYFTFRAPIPAELDSMKGIPQKRRNVVRRAVSMGLQAEVGRDADRFFELYAENARAHGTPALGRRFFRR
ncbi:MAG: peptidoglycan bridge formation protein FemAB, partial [Burkholderiaceae bacterium]